MRKPLAPLVLLVTLLLAACSTSSYSEAEQAGFVRDGVEETYGADPQPEWYGSFQDVAVENGWAYVSTSLTAADSDLAGEMCDDVAAVAFDDTGAPMGVNTVRIYGAGDENLADCDVPAE